LLCFVAKPLVAARTTWDQLKLTIDQPLAR
jgi:hypothetical protein